MRDKAIKKVGRRSFLKRGAKLLPALAVIGFAAVVLPGPARADCTGCSGACTGCSGGCQGFCNGDCTGGCRTTCTGTCRDGGK